MKIGIAGPISVRLLADQVEMGNRLPECYSFPQTAILVRGLVNRGHRVSVFALDEKATRTSVFRGLHVTIHVCPMRPHARDRGLDFFRAEREYLVNAMKEDPSEVIHANWTYEFAMAALDSGQDCIITARDAPYQILRFLPNSYRFIRLLMAHYVALRAPILVANSPYTARHFRRFMLYLKEIPIIPNGFPGDVFVPSGVRRKRDNGIITFASIVTGWGRIKNSKSLLKAFDIVRRRIPGSRLLLFGEGHGEAEVAQQWARDRQLEKNVTFCGVTEYVTLMRVLREQVDVYVHPAHEESFGNTVVEAMAQGIPVIGGMNSGAIPWLLGDGKAGMLSEVSNPMKLAGAMIMLGRDDNLQAKLGEAGWRRAYETFHLDRVLDKYVNLYRAITGRA